MATLSQITLDFNRPIKLSNDGGSLSSDTGTLLFKEFDEKLGFSQAGAKHLQLQDNRSFFIHSNEELFGQRIYQVIAGYAADHRRTIRFSHGFSDRERSLLSPACPVSGLVLIWNRLINYNRPTRNSPRSFSIYAFNAKTTEDFTTASMFEFNTESFNKSISTLKLRWVIINSSNVIVVVNVVALGLMGPFFLLHIYMDLIYNWKFVIGKSGFMIGIVMFVIGISSFVIGKSTFMIGKPIYSFHRLLKNAGATSRLQRFSMFLLL